MRRISHWTTSLLLLFLPLACVRSANPILNSDQRITNRDIEGQWVSQDGTDRFDVSPPSAANTYKVRMLDETFLAHLGKISDEILVLEIKADDSALIDGTITKELILPLYSFLIVEQTKPKLVFSTLDQNWLMRYLEAHPGELQYFKPNTCDLIVTSPTKDIQAFVKKHWHDAGAIDHDNNFTFVRPGDPTTRRANHR